MKTRIRTVTCALALWVAAIPLAAGDAPRFEAALGIGPVWQSRNMVEIPNDGTDTRFSLKDLVGSGAWTAPRFTFT